MSAYCNGAVLIAQGKIQNALESLQRALNIWNSLQLPYESACTRELKGIAYLELKDQDNSDAELAAAKWVFEQLNAIPDLERIKRLHNGKMEYMIYGLTLRELQVLRLVASGMTNKSVAAGLFISDRMFGSDQMVWPEKIGVAIESIRQAPFLFRSLQHL